MAITSNVGRILAGDHKIQAWREAGTLPAGELRVVEDRLREVLAL